jgi:hypothetical protein
MSVNMIDLRGSSITNPVLQESDVNWFTFVALNVDLGGQDMASIRSVSGPVKPRQSR